MVRFLQILAVICLMKGHAGVKAAGEKLELADYLDMQHVSDPLISPDGQHIVYSHSWVDKMKDQYDDALWIMDADGSNKRRFINGYNITWSPDSSTVAYVGSDNEGKSQIFLHHLNSGKTKQITASGVSAQSMAWSPNGKYIAFIASVPTPPDWAVELPSRPEGASWTEDPDIIEKYYYRRDGIGSIANKISHLFIVPSTGGAPERLTADGWTVPSHKGGTITIGWSLNWSPDSAKIAFDGSDTDALDFYSSRIYQIDVSTRKITALTTEDGVWSSPSYSPDGLKILYVGAKELDRSFPETDVWVMDINGENKTQITHGLSDEPYRTAWAKDSKGAYYIVPGNGSINIHHTTLSGVMKQVTHGTHSLNFNSISDTGIAAGTIESFTNPSQIVRFDIKTGKNLTKLTNVNENLFANTDFGSVEEVWFQSTENTKIQSWIVKPPSFDPSKKYPLYLSIHGGPHALYMTDFNFSHLEHAANGYVVLYMNPRGSAGYGTEFANAIQHQFPGRRDYEDLMAGVDATIAKGYIDPNQLYIEGCSAGGMLTTWVISRTNRFKAAVARCPFVNWISMSGTGDIAGWFSRFLPEPFWKNPSKWLEHSPIMHVDKVKTPILLMTGIDDLRTPLSQAEEYFSAMKRLGVPTKLIPMRGEAHDTGAIPSNFLRTQLYIRKWFEEHTP